MVYNTLSTKDPLCAVFAFEIGSVEASHPGPQRHQLPHPSWHLCGARWAVGGRQEHGALGGVVCC